MLLPSFKLWFPYGGFFGRHSGDISAWNEVALSGAHGFARGVHAPRSGHDNSTCSSQIWRGPRRPTPMLCFRVLHRRSSLSSTCYLPVAASTSGCWCSCSQSATLGVRVLYLCTILDSVSICHATRVHLVSGDVPHLHIVFGDLRLALLATTSFYPLHCWILVLWSPKARQGVF
jgi:hypothetical protein